MIQDFDIPRILPQKPPYIMVDKLTYYDPIFTKTIFTVRDDCVFCTDGQMAEAGLIENMAQTCAARMGYKERTEPHRDGIIKIGYVGMLKTFEVYRNPLVSEVLTTTIEIKDEVFSTSLVEAKVEIAGELIAKCEMKIFLTDKPATCP